MTLLHGRHELMYGDIKLFAGTACPELAQEIADHLDLELCGRDIVEFPNENLFVKLHKSVRGQDCYVIQTTSTPGASQPDGDADPDPDPAAGFRCAHHCRRTLSCAMRAPTKRISRAFRSPPAWWRI